jgi:putative endonuclease
MVNRRQKFGRRSEELAVSHLKKRGYKILERNYRTRLGEIDIIARDGRSLAFVEVKARKSTSFGNPKWAVTPKKQMKISMVALEYLKRTGQSNAKARFDVVTIIADKTEPHVELIQNAFELAYK